MELRTGIKALAVVVVLSVLVRATQQGCDGPPGCICNDRIAVCYIQARLNSIPEFPSSVTKIQMRGNLVQNLSENSLQRYENLTLLNLEGNRIAFISYQTFAHNAKLRNLNLEHNRLSVLQPYTFSRLHSLKTLALDYNQLENMNDEIFHGLGNLTQLSLKGNNIKVLHSSAMESLGSLQTLDLSHNPLHCDCEMSWMKEFNPLSNNAVCFTPPSLTGRQIRSIPYEELGCSLQVGSPAPRIQASHGDQGVELPCQIQGTPTPSIKWFFDSTLINNSQNYRIASNNSLIIVVMLPQLAGIYTCIASNVLGDVGTTVTLEHTGPIPPILTVAPMSNVHEFVGSSFFLPCEAIMETGTYQWYRNGTELHTNSRHVIEPGVGLRVAMAQTSDSGVYTCVVSNEAGSVNATVTVQVTNSVLTCDGVIRPGMIDQVREMVSLAFTRTREALRNSSTSPHSLLRRLRFPDSGIIDYLKAAEVFDLVVNQLRDELLRNSSINKGNEIPELSECELEVLGELSGCSEHQRETDCSSCFHQKYRSIDGSCNNLDHPLRGASDTPFIRLVEPAYEDGVGLPVGWTGGKPSAREISRKVIATKRVTRDENFSLMLMQVGQFLDHDLDLALGSPSDIVFNSSDPSALSDCAHTCTNDAPCFPIPAAKDDPRIDGCIPFTRSSAVCGTGASSLLLGNTGIHREQINGITSFIDGSMIYGSLERTNERLREDGESGKLREGEALPGLTKKLLPFEDDESIIECTTGVNAHRSRCFLGGDVRTNEQVGLTSMHTLFNREHNRVVAVLTQLNPDWDGEKLYQEARRIVVAEWQNIVYSGYLPKILGADFLGGYRGYDPNIDASVSNAFATAAYRFGHSQIMPLFPRLDSNYEPLPIGPLKLENAFFSPFRITEEGGIDPLVRGLISSPVKMRLSHQGLNNNLTEALFAQAHEVALDLAALNIQRGRDHGLPNYNTWRKYCNLSSPSTIEGLKEHISNTTILDRLRDVYGDNPNNIDLFVGGLLEDTLPGSQLGPTFKCIIGNQFRRSRDGDRFFFERPGQFTPDQLVQLKQASLSRIICDNSDGTTRVPADAFILQDTADFVPCSDIPTVDLLLWKECGECEEVGNSRRKRSALLQPHLNDDYAALLQKVSQLEEKIESMKTNGQNHFK